MYFYRTRCSNKYRGKIVHTITRMFIHSHYMYCILYYLYADQIFPNWPAPHANWNKLGLSRD